ncbi:MAG: prepilin peptidase [Lachnospiraceae bacterium]|nr:prepilin peptidase [Lachnospiraceae bacterium]
MLFLCIFLLIAAVKDLTAGKIPNRLILIGMMTGVLVSFLRDGWPTVLLQIPTLLLPLFLLFPLFSMGVLGAGDIKLFMMIGSFFSFVQLLFCLYFSFLLGGVTALIHLIRHRNFSSRTEYLFTHLKMMAQTRRLLPYHTEHSDLQKETYTIHFAIPIFFATLIQIGGICL